MELKAGNFMELKVRLMSRLYAEVHAELALAQSVSNPQQVCS